MNSALRSSRFAAGMLVLLLAGGCASYHNVNPDAPYIDPKIVLKPGQFRLVRTVTGEASCPFFLWIDIPKAIDSLLPVPIPLITFELGDSQLNERAMRDLHSKYDMLGKPQILHNFLEEWTVANYLGLFAIVRVSISAEVIEFTGGTAQ